MLRAYIMCTYSEVLLMRSHIWPYMCLLICWLVVRSYSPSFSIIMKCFVYCIIFSIIQPMHTLYALILCR